MQPRDGRVTHGAGIAAEAGGRPIRLKWHRLRRRRTDPAFSLDALQTGLKHGASMEVDLRVRADFGFAVLHDARLDRETTGKGRVAAMTRTDLAGIAYDDGQNAHGRRLLCSEDLAENLLDASGQAVLQFDMKDDLGAVTARGLDHLVEYFSRPPVELTVSGDSEALVVAIAERLPDLRRGVDPTDELVRMLRTEGSIAAEQKLVGILRGPSRPDIIYLAWELLLAAGRAGLDLVGLCHDFGKTVDAWTYNPSHPEKGYSDEEWAQVSCLIGLGIDQLTTDEPLATETAIAERAN